MKDRYSSIIEKLIQDRKVQKRARKIVALLAVFVLLLTTDSLKMIASTLEWGKSAGVVSSTVSTVDQPAILTENSPGAVYFDPETGLTIEEESARGLVNEADAGDASDLDVEVRQDRESAFETLSGHVDIENLERDAEEMNDIDLASAMGEPDGEDDIASGNDADGLYTVSYSGRNLSVRVSGLDDTSFPAGTTVVAQWIADKGQKLAYQNAIERAAGGKLKTAIMNMSLLNGGSRIQANGPVYVEVDLLKPVKVGDGYNFAITALDGNKVFFISGEDGVRVEDGMLLGFWYETDRIGDVAVVWQAKEAPAEEVAEANDFVAEAAPAPAEAAPAPAEAAPAPAEAAPAPAEAAPAPAEAAPAPAEAAPEAAPADAAESTGETAAADGAESAGDAGQADAAPEGQADAEGEGAPSEGIVDGIKNNEETPDAMTAPEGTTDETTEGTADETTEGATDETAEGATDETTEGTADETAEGTADETTEGTADETTEGATDETAEGTADETTEGATDETTEGTDEDSTGDTEGETGEGTDVEDAEGAGIEDEEKSEGDEEKSEEDEEKSEEDEEKSEEDEEKSEEDEEKSEEDEEKSEEDKEKSEEDEEKSEEEDEQETYAEGVFSKVINGCKVTLTWGPEAEIPEDVVIEVKEIERGTEEYDALYNQAVAMLPEADEADTQVMRFFDITLYSGEEKIEPKAPVNVDVRLDETVQSEVSAMHYAETEQTGETAPVLVDATAEGKTVSFEAESFSTYGLAYTKPATQVENTASISVDLSSVDMMDAATVGDEGVSLSVSQLLRGDDDAVVVSGKVDVSADKLMEGDVEASDGVEVQGKSITLSDEALESGSVTLEVTTKETVNYEKTITTHKVEIELTGYAGRTKEIQDDAGAVTVTAADGNSLPRDASVELSDAVTSVQVVETPAAEPAEPAAEDADAPAEAPADVEAPAEAPAEASAGKVVGEAAYDITITNGNDQTISRTGEVDVTVKPAEEINVYSEVPSDAAVKGISYTLTRMHEGEEPEEIPVKVKLDREGKIAEFSFSTDRFSEYKLNYTVDFEYLGDKGYIQLNFTDFDAVSAENGEGIVYDTAECDVRVALGLLGDLLAGETAGEDSDLERNDIAVKTTLADGFSFDFGKAEALEQSDGVKFADGELVITADGRVELTDGVQTLYVGINGLSALKEEILKAEGVSIKVMEGKVPLGARASYEVYDEEKTAELVDAYLAPEAAEDEGESDEENEKETEVGYSAADLKIVRNDAEIDAKGLFKVTLAKRTLIPEGMKLDKIFHIHDGEVEEVKAKETDVGLEFTVNDFSDIVIRYTVEFHNDEKEVVIPGGSQVLLSTLIDALSLTRANGEPFTVDEVEKVEFNTPELFTVEEVTGTVTLNANTEDEQTVEITTGHDFLLTSLLPFDVDRMFITLTDGEVVEMRVTDTQSGTVFETTPLFTVTAGENQTLTVNIKEGDQSYSFYGNYYLYAAVEKDGKQYGYMQSFMSDGVTFNANSWTQLGTRSNNASTPGERLSLAAGDTIKFYIITGQNNSRPDSSQTVTFNFDQQFELRNNTYSLSIGDKIGDKNINAVNIDSSNTTATIVMGNPPKYNVGIHFVNADGSTPVSDPGITGTYYYLVTVKNSNNNERYAVLDPAVVFTNGNPVEVLKFYTDGEQEDSTITGFNGNRIEKVELVTPRTDGAKPSIKDARNKENGCKLISPNNPSENVLGNYLLSGAASGAHYEITGTKMAAYKVVSSFVDGSEQHNAITPALADEYYLVAKASIEQGGQRKDCYYVETYDPARTAEITRFYEGYNETGYNPENFTSGINVDVCLVKKTASVDTPAKAINAMADSSIISGEVEVYTLATTKATDQTTLTFTQNGEVYTSTVKFYDVNAKVVDTPSVHVDETQSTQEAPTLTKNYYMVATIKDKTTHEIAGWAINPVNLNGRKETSTLFRQFYPYGTDGSSTEGTPIAYSTTDFNYDIETRLYCSDDPIASENLNYKYLVTDKNALDNAENGYEYAGCVYPDASHSVIYAKKSYPKKYAVRVRFIAEDDSTLQDIQGDTDYHVFVTVTHADNTTHYWHPMLKLTKQEIQQLPRKNGYHYLDLKLETNWFNQNGVPDTDPSAIFTGNEKNIHVELVQRRDSQEGMSHAKYGGSTKFVEGDSLGNYTIHYDTKETDPKETNSRFFEEKDDEHHVTLCYDLIDLTLPYAASEYDYATILGPNYVYGIVADHLYHNNDLQTNFAVNHYTGHGDYATPDLSGSSSGAIVIGEFNRNTDVMMTNHVGPVVNRNSTDDEDIKAGTLPIGNNVQGVLAIYVDNDSGVPFQDTAYPVKDTSGRAVVRLEDGTSLQNNIVNPAIQYGVNMSRTLVAKQATYTPVIPADGKPIIDTTGFPDGATIYIDADRLLHKVDGSEDIYGDFYALENLKINKLDNQLLVFNFKETRNVRLDQFKVKQPSLSSYEGISLEDGYFKTNTTTNQSPTNQLMDQISRHIVWNMSSVTGRLEIKEGGGMYLQPNRGSETKISATSGGWLVSNGYVYNDSAEWHNFFSEMPDNTKVNLHALKTVDGRVPNAQFNFALSEYTKTPEEWTVKETKQNAGGSVEWTINDPTPGWHVYRIQETSKPESNTGKYVMDAHEYFAVVHVTSVMVGTDEHRIASSPLYYETFTPGDFTPGGETAPNVSTPLSLPVFQNQELKKGLTLKKFVNGTSSADVTFTFRIEAWKDADDDYKAAHPGATTMPVDSEEKTYPVTGILGVESVKFTPDTTKHISTAELSLRNGQSATIGNESVGLPQGARYKILETKVGDKEIPAILVDNDSHDVYVDGYRPHNVNADTHTQVPLEGVIAEDGTIVTFENDYSASGSMLLSGHKALQKIAQTTETVSVPEGAFGFQLINGEVIQTVYNNANGEVVFEDIQFTEDDMVGATEHVDGTRSKIITYTVHEINGNQSEEYYSQIINDEDRIIMVKLVDDGKGQITAKIVSEVEGTITETDPANFTFHFNNRKGVEAVIEGSKVLTGRDMKSNEEFTFELKEGETVLSTTTVTGAQDGQNRPFHFPAIQYTHADVGTHTYTVSEVEPGEHDSLLVYDKATFTVTVDVAEDAEGKLTATVNYPEDVVFNNTAGEKTSISVEKVWNDGLADHEKDYVKVQLYKVIGDKVPETQNENTEGQGGTQNENTEGQGGTQNETPIASGNTVSASFSVTCWKDSQYNDINTAAQSGYVTIVAKENNVEKGRVTLSAENGWSGTISNLTRKTVVDENNTIVHGYNLSVDEKSDNIMGVQFSESYFSDRNSDCTLLIQYNTSSASAISPFQLAYAGDFLFGTAYADEETNDEVAIALPQYLPGSEVLPANATPVGDEVVTLSTFNNWKYTWTALPKVEDGHFVYYYVVETHSSLQPDSTSYEVQYYRNETPARVQLVTITNEVSAKGSLRVEKELDGLTYADLTDEQKQALAGISFTITGPGDYSSTVTLENALEGINIENLNPGTYTVTENREDATTPSGYRHVTTTVKVGEGQPATTVTAEAEVTSGQRAIFHFVNEYEQVGALKIEKDVWVDEQGPNGADEWSLVNGDYIFSVARADASNTVLKYVLINYYGEGQKRYRYKLADENTPEAWDQTEFITDGYAVVGNLSEGDYIVKELDPANGASLVQIERGDKWEWVEESEYWAEKDDYNPNVADLENKSVTLHVTAGVEDPDECSTAIAYFTNNKWAHGALKIKKIVQHNGSSTTDERLDGGYEFSVVGPMSADVANRVTKYVRIIIRDGEIINYGVRDSLDGFTGTWWENFDSNDNDRWAVVKGLPAGDYQITELGAYNLTGHDLDIESTPRDDIVLEGISGGKGDGNKTNRTVTVTVTVGDPSEVSAEAKATYTNGLWDGKLDLLKKLEASTNAPVNGDLTRMNGTYKFTVTGPLDENDQPVDGAITKYVQIYANTTETTDASGKVTYSQPSFKYEIKDTDSGWSEENASSMPATGVPFSNLKTGTYMITETEWSISVPSDMGMYLKTADVVDTSTDNSVVTYYDRTQRTVKWVVDGTKSDPYKATFTNRLEPNTATLRKMVLDTNDSTNDSPFINSSEQTWSDSADFDIGDHVPYRITAFLPQDAYQASEDYYFKIEDVMQNLEYVENSGRIYVFVKGPQDTVGKWYDVTYDPDDQPYGYFGITSSREASHISATPWLLAQGNDTLTYLKVETLETEGLKAVTKGREVTNWDVDTHTAAYNKLKQPVLGREAEFNAAHIQYIQFRYDAELLTTANIGATGNANDAMVYFGNESQYTDWDRNRVFTYKIRVNKQYETKEGFTRTGNAVFALYKKYKSHTNLEYSKRQFGNGNDTFLWADNEDYLPKTVLVPTDGVNAPGDYYYVAPTTNGGSTGESYEWNGLDDGNYILVELNAPDGYAAMPEPFQFSITAAHDYESDDPQLSTGSNTYLSVHPEKIHAANDIHADVQYVLTTDGKKFNDGVVTAVVINKLYQTNITIKKVAKGMPDVTLSGAVFELYRKTGTNAQGDDVWAKVTDSSVGGVGADGTFTVYENANLTGLTDGKYQIREVSPPNGYVITSTAPVTFTLEKGKVTYENGDLAEGVTYKKADAQPATDNDVFTIPNTRGVVMPATGGSGTALFTAGGVGLLALALLGWVLHARRRWRGEGID